MSTAIRQFVAPHSSATEQEGTAVDFLDSTTNTGLELLPNEQVIAQSPRVRTEQVPPGKRAYYQYRYRHRAIDWRWRRARELLETGELIDPLRDDARVEQIRGYLRLAIPKPKKAAQAYPELASAQQIREEGGRQDALIRAWLLTELSSSDVAARLDIPLEIIETYAMMFFDLGDRRANVFWVISHVIQLHGRRFEDFEEMEFAAWQLTALDGVHALDDLLKLAHLNQYRGNAPLQRIDEAILNAWKYRAYILSMTTPWITGNPVAWQWLYLEQRELELDRQRQSLIKRASRRKTRHDARSCSTRSNSYGPGDAAGIIEAVLLSFCPCRAEGPENLLRSRGMPDGDFGRDDDHGTNALEA